MADTIISINDDALLTPAPPAHARERDLARMRLLWRQRLVLARFLAWGALLSLILAFVIPPQYKAKVELMPPDAGMTGGMAMLSALSGGDFAMGALASQLMGVHGTSDLFVGVLRSRTIEDDIINRFDLRKAYSVKYYEQARRILARRSDLDIDRKSGIITVSVTDRHPQRAAAIAQAYVDELNQRVAKVSTSAAHRERVFLEQRLQTVQQELHDSVLQLSQFASKNTTIDLKEQGRAMIEAAAALQGQLIAAQSELSGLEQIYKPNNIRVQSVRARIGELQRQLEKLRGSDDSLKDLSGGDELYPSIRKLPLLGVQYVDLYRKAKVNEAVFESLSKQYELAKVQEAKEIPTVKVLDAPVEPERKSSPPRTIIVLLGLVLSLGCGMVWIVNRERWNTTPDDDARKSLVREVVGDVRAWTAQLRGRRWHRPRR